MIEKNQELWELVLSEVEGIKKKYKMYAGSWRDVAYTSGKDVLTIFKITKVNGEVDIYVIKAFYYMEKAKVETLHSTEKRSIFWEEKKIGGKTAIINDNWYEIGEKTKPGNFNGFGGSWYEIAFDDGRKVKTCDLWSCGVIPPYYRRKFKNNAKFVR